MTIDRLRRIVEKSDTTAGRTFDIAIQTLIIISLVTFSIETLPGLSESARSFLRVAEIVIVAIFTAEYLLRLLITQRRLKFVFSFYGMIDLLAIAPFYITTGLDLRAVRALRLLRLLRIFKLTRYSVAVQRYRYAFNLVRPELVLFLGVAGLLLYLASVGIYYCENAAQPDKFSSVFDGMWWALITLTTVGYGDMYPITIGGRIFTFVILVIGLGVVAVPSGLMATALGEARKADLKHEADPEAGSDSA